MEIRDDALVESVKSVVEELHGDEGRATVAGGLRTIYCNSATGICLVQVRAGRPHALLASAVPFIRSVKGHKVVPRTVYTGATIRNCYKVEPTTFTVPTAFPKDFLSFHSSAF